MHVRNDYVAARFTSGCFREFVSDPDDLPEVTRWVEEQRASGGFRHQDDIEIFELVPVNGRTSHG